MTDSAPPEKAASLDHVAEAAGSRWAKLFEQLKRFRAPLAGAAIVAVALISLAFVQLPVWQTIVTIASVGAVLGGLAGFWNAYSAVKKSVLLSSSSKAPVAASALSVMVLPFQNHTGDATQGYVADGLTASLTADLSRIRDAFIVSAATAFAYKDKPITAQQAGAELGVHFVLHGSVQRSGTKIRINAQLADTTTNAQLLVGYVRGRPIRSVCAARPSHGSHWQQHRTRSGYRGRPRERNAQEQPQGSRPDFACEGREAQASITEELAAGGAVVPPGPGAGTE